MKTLFSALIMIIIFSSAVFSDELSDHIFIASLEEAAAPQYMAESDALVFTYQNEMPRFQPRYVGVAFEHENFSRIHDMRYQDNRNDEGELISRIFFFFLPVDSTIEEMDSITYRYVVDGIWIEDPRNPAVSQKISGNLLSIAKLPADREIPPQSPEVMPVSTNSRSRVVRFLYMGEPGQQVFLAGSFNNWDPFMYMLEENPITPGEYSIEIRLLPGNYQYNYYYRGRKIKDPLNVLSSYDIEGFEYSFFSVDS